jgi:hypothetical protein
MKILLVPVRKDLFSRSLIRKNISFYENLPYGTKIGG